MSLIFPIDAKLKDGSPVQLVLADNYDIEPLRKLYRVIVEEGTSYPHDRFPDEDDFMDYWFRGKGKQRGRLRLLYFLDGMRTHSRRSCYVDSPKHYRKVKGIQICRVETGREQKCLTGSSQSQRSTTFGSFRDDSTIPNYVPRVRRAT